MTRTGKSILWTVAAVVAGAVAWDSFYIVHETEQGVLTHFGRISPPVRQPGFHLKWPRPVSKVYKVDRRIQTMTDLPHELITEDQKSVLVDGYLLWRTVDPILFVEAIRTGTNAVEKLRDLYLSSLGVVVSNKARDAFISLGLEHEEFDQAADEILARIEPVARANYGIEVMRAGVVEYTLPQENRPSVIQRMVSERARIAARYRAEGEEAAMRIEALAVSEHEKLVAEAHAEATVILGEAEAEAMALLGEAYREDPEFYQFIRALDSYDLIIDENTTLMLPADNELFRYLDSGEIPDTAAGRDE
ncbi:MAG: protease modulator HflC [Gammaproteobacteria bacterium]|nr:protease modulator HflC [Gammaproteobacteria bacterium]